MAKNKTVYDIGSRPKEERLFTAQEAAEMCGYTRAYICCVYKKLNIKPEKKLVKKAKMLMFTYQQLQQIIQYSKESFEKKKEINKKIALTGNLTIEEQKLLHPLVTDERFLKLDFFPNVIPNCFNEIDDWVV